MMSNITDEIQQMIEGQLQNINGDNMRLKSF